MVSKGSLMKTRNVCKTIKYVFCYVMMISAFTGMSSSIWADARIQNSKSVQGTNSSDPLFCHLFGNYNEPFRPISWPTVQEKKVINPSCWLSLPQVEALQNENDVVLVDVRQQTLKHAMPIAGLLSMSAYEIKDSVFLKNQHVVLIGSGFDQVMLNKVCEQLREDGFSYVYVLNGGAYRWMKQHTQQFSDAIEITPEDFWLGGQTIPWEIVTVGLDSEQIAHLPQKPWLQITLSDEGAIERLGDQAMALNNNGVIDIVLIAANKQIQQHLQQMWQEDIEKIADQGIYIVWLEGGMYAYEAYVAQQYNVLSHANISLKQSCADLIE